MPKCEIFDRSDFNILYTIKSLREGDFRVKIKKIEKNIYGFIGAPKFLTRMLGLILRSAVPSKHATHTHSKFGKGLQCMLSIGYASGTDACTEHARKELTRILRVRIRK